MSKARLRAAGVAATLAIVPVSASAQAQFSGNTTGQPTYNRVVTGAPPTTLSGTGTAVTFQAFHFRVRGAGNYQFDTIRDSHPDTFITLYSGLFNAGAPLSGAIASDDDSGGTFLSSRLIAPLAAGQRYTFVTSAFSNGEQGSYLFTLAGPGDLVLSDAEVATAALQSGQATTRAFLDIVNQHAGFALTGVTGGNRQAPAGMMLAGLKDIDAAPPPSAPSRLQVWVQGYGGHEKIDSKDDAGPSSFSNRNRGVALGGDLKLAPGMAIGVAAAFGTSNFSVHDIQGSGTADNYRFAVYGGWAQGSAYVTGSLGFGRDSVDTSRSLGFAPVTGETTITEFLGHGEVGLRYGVGGGVALNPFAGIQFGHQSLDGFSETEGSGGSGLLPLAIADRDDWWVQSLLGVRLSTVWDRGGMKIQPTVAAAWVHNFSDAPTVNASVLGSPNFVSLVDGVARAENLARLSAGLAIDLSTSAQLSLSYKGEFADGTRDQSGTAALTFRW